MTLDDFWLDDTQLTALSGRLPSTELGRRLDWSQSYGEPLVSSDTYRGGVIVLSMLTHLLSGRDASIGVIEQAIEAVNDALEASTRFAPGAPIQGGAAIVLANAWERAHCGAAAQQVIDAYESEMIHLARVFVAARAREIAGEILP